MPAKIETKKLTLLAVFTAVKVIMLIVCMSLPSARLSVLCVISAINGLLYRSGTRVSHILISFAATAILGYLFMVNPSIYIIYVCCFALYGIVHHIFRNKSFMLKQLVRWGYFVVAISLTYIIITYVMHIPYSGTISIYLLLVIAMAGFAVFQFAYEIVIEYILSHPYLRRLFFSH